jgi:hypothetical protein
MKKENPLCIAFGVKREKQTIFLQKVAINSKKIILIIILII